MATMVQIKSPGLQTLEPGYVPATSMATAKAGPSAV